MKFRKSVRPEFEFEEDDGVDPRTFFRKGERKKTNRKALQLCGEIARTVGWFLAWESGDDWLRSLTVVSVEPAPDSTRVLVTVCPRFLMEPVDAGQLAERLQRITGKLRTEVAAAIHRKKVPELVFRIAYSGEVES
jgi:ribosome-binding factor A